MQSKTVFARQIILASVVVANFIFMTVPLEAASSITVVSDHENQVNFGEILADKKYENKTLVNIPNGSREEINLVLYGMGAAPDAWGKQPSGVALTNQSEIEVHLWDLVAYGEKKNYARIMGRAMAGGDSAVLVNNGAIHMFMDQGAAYQGEAFMHGMIAGEGSCIINNGEVEISGSGSDGANPRGITSDSNKIKIINNGIISIQVADTYMARGLTSVGKQAELENRGMICVDSDSIAFGIAQGGGSTVANHGLVEVSSQGIWPEDTCGMLPKMTPMAYGMIAYGGLNSDTFLENTGLIRAKQAPNAKGYRAYAIAVTTGLDVPDPIVIRNNGIAEAENGYEFGVNMLADFYQTPEPLGKLTVLPSLWATTLRDFSHHFFALGSQAVLDFTGAKLILRPGTGYREGDAYSVEQHVLVDQSFRPWEVNGLYAPAGTVINFDQLEFVSEMPEFLRVGLTPDRKQAAIFLSGRRTAAENLLHTSALSSVNFARQGLERLDNTLQNMQIFSEADGWELYLAPYYGHLRRDQGMNLNMRGFLGGVQRGLNSDTQIGWHFGYHWGSGDGGIYEAKSGLHAVMAGFNAKRSFRDGAYLRGQIGGYFGAGDTEYSFISPYGTRLYGHSNNAAAGIYSAVYYGKEQSFQLAGRRLEEIGVSGLMLHLDPDVQWHLLQQKLPGYDMDLDETYHALFAHAAVRWETEKPAFGGTVNTHLGLGMRVKLSGDKIGMRMVGVPVDGSVSESSTAFTVNAGCTWSREQAWSATLSYRGTFETGARAHEMQAVIKRHF